MIAARIISLLPLEKILPPKQLAVALDVLFRGRMLLTGSEWPSKMIVEYSRSLLSGTTGRLTISRSANVVP